MDCLFCKIIKNKISSFTIYENDLVKVILDINPSTNGDALIIPKRHYQNMFDIDDELLICLNETSKYIYQLYQTKLQCIGMTLVQNNDFGQDIKHYHLHLTPRYQNDNLKINFNKNLLKPLEEIHHKIIN